MDAIAYSRLNLSYTCRWKGARYGKTVKWMFQSGMCWYESCVARKFIGIVGKFTEWEKTNYIRKQATMQLYASHDEHVDGLVQDCSNSNALAMKLLQPCT